MCEQCSAEVDEYGRPLEGWMLCRASRDAGGSFDMKKGQWGLVECNDPTYIWDATPVVDPTNGFTDAELELKDKAFWAENDKWMDLATSFSNALKGRPQDGWALYEACLKAGYTKEHGALGYWLFDYLGRWLRDHPEPTEKNRPFTSTLDVGEEMP